MKWYVKQLAEIANVSVKTLHHYDKIGLLTPSCREDNRYRLYSEDDLLRLQQITALKFLGFELNQIKTLLDNKRDLISQLELQQDLLKRKSDSLLQACDILQRVAEDFQRSQSIPWQSIIKSIEVYHMTQQIEEAWVKEIFNEEELKEYAEFEVAFKEKFKDKEKFHNEWFAIIKEINANLDIDPRSAKGIELGKRTMEWVNSVYGKKYAHLRTKKFEQGFGEGKGLEEHGLTPAIVDFMDKSVDAYWRERILSVLNAINKKPDDELIKQWWDLMDDLYGNEEARKYDLLEIIYQDDEATEQEKAWLKTHIEKLDNA